MRTTLNLDEEVLRALRTLASEQKRSLGAVASDLIRRGLAPRDDVQYRGDFPVFSVRENAPPITLDMVRRALDDD